MGKPWNDKLETGDLAVVIGRFQPLHYGHIYNIDKGLKEAKKVVVLIGSAFSATNVKNPFTWEEREQMIKDYYQHSPDRDRIFIEPLSDFMYEENQWLIEVQDLVAKYSAERIVLIGHSKDESSYYLNSFPHWEFSETGRWPSTIKTVDATKIRELYYSEDAKFLSGVVPNLTYNFLVKFKQTDRYQNLIEEKTFIDNYIKSWSHTPYPATFNTVDAIVVQSGHILLVQRKEQPGKDLWAMPGGFVQVEETLEDACIRELREETKLKVPVPVIKGSIVKNRTFDNPKRSLRGRTITQAFLIQLKNEEPLPKVKGSDDAKEAKWIPLIDFYDMESEMYEDHYHIIKKMIDNE